MGESHFTTEIDDQAGLHDDRRRGGGFPPDAPTWIRTRGLLLRRESLYPAELSGRARASLGAARAGGEPYLCRHEVSKNGRPVRLNVSVQVRHTARGRCYRDRGSNGELIPISLRASSPAKGLRAWCLAALAVPAAGLGLEESASASPGQVDPSFVAPAVNNRVFTVAVQPDGKILIGGTFTQVNGQGRTSVARLNTNGSLDGTFSPPTLFRQVQTIAVQPDGKILIGGNVFPFDSDRAGLMRLNASGSIDEDFVDPILRRPGIGDGTVESVALQPDGKIVIGGDFTCVGAIASPSCPPDNVRNRVARLNANGTLDLGFAPPGPNGEVKTVALDADGKVLIGGNFTSLGGVAREGAARLGVSGALDESFVNPEVGAGSGTPTVNSIAPQPDAKVLIGGAFTRVGGQPPPANERGGAARLNADGTLDGGYDNPYFGGVVNSVALQRNGEALFGGAFFELSTGRGAHLARLEAIGALDTSFTSPLTNTFLGSVESLALQPDGKLLLSVIDQRSSPTAYEVLRVLSTSPQAAPASVSATAGDGEATVSWSAVPGEISGYTAAASSGGRTCTATSATSCTVTGLTNGTSYTFSVTAANEFGNGVASAPSTAVTPRATPAPTPDPGPSPEPSPSPAPAPAPTPAPTPSPTPLPTVEVSSARAKVTGKSVTLTSRVNVSGAGRIEQRATTGSGRKAKTWCRAAKGVAAPGTQTIECKLGSAGRRALKKGTLKLTLRTSYAPSLGGAVTADRRVTIKRKR